MFVVEVPQLSLHSAIGEPGQDPHGQGFAVVFAELKTRDEELIKILSPKSTVTLRCGMLDVTGQIAKVEKAHDLVRIVLAVEDLVYRKPVKPRITTRGKI